MTAMQPAVSVIVPAFNAARWIADGLDSILGQDLRDIEVLVVDDASTDATAEIAAAYQRRDPRVRLLRHDVNRGVSAARNTALAVAAGDWIAPVDADDTLAAGRLRRLVDAAERMRADLLADNIVLTSFPDRRPLETALAADSALFDGPLTLADFLDRDRPGRFSPGYLKPLIRRRFLSDRNLSYRPELPIAEDFALYVDCLIEGASFHLIPEALYFYALRGDSLSRLPGGQLHELAVMNRAYLAMPVVQRCPEWRSAFARRQADLEAHLAYAELVRALKRAHVGGSLRALSRGRRHAAFFANGLLDAGIRRLTGRAYRIEGSLR